MTPVEKIGIFCSTSDNIDLTFFDAAHQIDERVGRNGKTLIYGGANLGLMGCAVRTVKESGGYVIGVVPSKLEENGKVSTCLDEMTYTHNLSDRRNIILQQLDVLVALSGGISTLDEVSHVMAAAPIGYHQKKVIFYNTSGFYSPLLAVLNELQARGFTRHPPSSYYKIANIFSELTIKI